MINSSAFAIRLFSAVFLSFFFVVGAHAGSRDWTRAYAVLGRGVENKQTGERLQLACVGEPARDESGELHCAEVQFLETDLAGNVREIGPTLQIGSELKTSSDLRRFLKKRVKELKASGDIQHRSFFSSTASWFGDESIPVGTKMLPVLLGGGAALVLATGGAPILAVAGISLFAAFPIGIDILVIPLSLGASTIRGEYFIESKTLAVSGYANDRNPNAWQIRPRRVSEKNYGRFKKVISAPYRRVLHVQRFVSEVSDGRGILRVDVELNDGQIERIENPKNLVIYDRRGERRGYDGDSHRDVEE